MMSLSNSSNRALPTSPVSVGSSPSMGSWSRLKRAQPTDPVPPARSSISTTPGSAVGVQPGARQGPSVGASAYTMGNLSRLGGRSL